MKKKITMLCALFCSLSLVACGGKKGDSTNPSGPSSDISVDDDRETWTVTFDLNYQGGGIYHTFDVDRSPYGVNIQSLMPENPTRDGNYTFNGWYHDTYCKVEWVYMRDRIFADTTLYANWKVTGGDPDPVKQTAITWNEDVSFTYQAVTPATLPTLVDQHTKISFKIMIHEQYEGTPIVKAGNQTLVANQEVYSFEATGERMTVSVSGLTKKPIMEEYVVTFQYTIPTWNPIVTNPKIYYWGTDKENQHIENTVNWTSASDSQGAMTHVSGNDYSLAIHLNEGDVITGVIVLMYQSGVKKQSQDLTVNITITGTYQITYLEGDWVPNSNGEYCFPASIAAL